nr:WD repeat-containing protein 87 [Polyrhizophydium stewartii]
MGAGGQDPDTGDEGSHGVTENAGDGESEDSDQDTSGDSDGTGSGDSSDEERRTRAPRAGEDAVPVKPWKTVCRKIERIATRYFGAAKVKEASRVRQGILAPSRRALALGSSAKTGHLRNASSPNDRRAGLVGQGIGGARPSIAPRLLPTPVRRASFIIAGERQGGWDVGLSSSSQDLEDAFGGSTGSLPHASNALNISIPHGCQIMRTMTHPKSVLKSVVYMPFGETERFASQDAHYAHVWRGSTHILKVATRPNKDALPTSVTGLNKWLYINKWRILIIATLHLELKILDAGLKVWSSIASPKPIISLEFVDEHDELVVGGVGAITIYGFEKNHGSSGAIVDFKEPRLVINDLQIDEWVTFTAFDRTREYLYAVFDNNFTIYSYITGHRIESMRNVHENSISAVLFYEPLSYFVTGSKDATTTVKVWNQQNYLLYEFKDHYNAITGFCQVNGFGCGAFPYILSCSLDGTIRMWNLENGRFIYKMHTQAECLGMHWMRDGTFFSYSSETISVWFLSRFYTTLTQIRQVADGSMSLVSPRTGERLTTAFPVMADTFMVDCVYDIGLDLIYTLATNGDVTVYSSFSNPCAIIDEWKYVGESVLLRADVSIAALDLTRWCSFGAAREDDLCLRTSCQP